jgi:serine/threonine-protein kinase
VRPVGSKYLLEEPLGRGATGTVWRGRIRAEDGTVVPGEAVAVKVLKEELAGDPDVVMRFLRERSVLLRLRHPHIVRVRDLVVEGDLLALVMDLIDGPDLHRYLRDNGPFSPVGAALLTATVADALASSHADGVVHRDLKPANVLIATVVGEDGTERMHPMLTDFGIARLADSPGVTRTHEFVGTPAYVAPESAQGRPQTSAVDVYGAGILLYELLTGRPPFRGESAIEVLHHHLNDTPQRPGNVPEPLWTVIERCLRKEPAQRPSAESLARALRLVAAGVGVHSTPAQVEAAYGVAGLLAPDTTPTLPGVGAGGDFDPTTVLPSGSAAFGSYDPNAATSVLQSDARAPDGSRLLPPAPQDPPRPPQVPQGPHPWESQLSAARHRNEQTEVQQHLPPELDPLRRRPRRQPGPGPTQQPPPYGGRPERPNPQPGQQGAQGYGYPPQSPQEQPRSARPPVHERPQRRYEPEPYERQRPPASRPPAEPPRGREPRGRANPVKIPGLGCLKGCLVVILVLVVVFVLIWYTTPLPGWVNSTRNLWDAASSWVSSVWHQLSTLTGNSGGSTGGSTGGPGGVPGRGSGNGFGGG